MTVTTQMKFNTESSQLIWEIGSKTNRLPASIETPEVVVVTGQISVDNKSVVLK